MKKYTTFFVCCLVMLFAAVTVHAQTGFTGPGATGFTGTQGATGQFGYGYSGQVQNVPVAQAQSYGHRTPIIVTGTIVQAIGHDLYLFRDSSGEITLRIGPREWMYFGSTISPSDTIEIYGEVHRPRHAWNGQAEIHARQMRKI